MITPRAGETVHLLCMKCHHTFMGPCPDRRGLGVLLNICVKKAKCPKCGSFRVVLNPVWRY